VHDKGLLLAGLLQECRDLGVKVLLGTNVNGVEKKGGKVHVLCEEQNVEAPFVIAADGANSKLAQVLKLNRQRTYYGLMKIQGVEIRGVENFDSHTFYSFITGMQNPTYSVLVPLPTQEEGCFQAFTVVFDPDADVAKQLSLLLNKSHFAPFFKNSRIVCRTAAVENIFSSMQTPYHDQVLFIGDAAWCQEIEITAALMCGWNAGNTMAFALNENKICKEGLESYLNWWNRSCLGLHDHRQYLRNYALSFLMTDEEIDYLFDQIDTVMPAIFNPYRALDLLGQGLSKSMDKISQERPEIARKIQIFSSASPEELMQTPIQSARMIPVQRG
jgi:flavin-dependent dehydrogenase